MNQHRKANTKAFVTRPHCGHAAKQTPCLNCSKPISELGGVKEKISIGIDEFHKGIALVVDHTEIARFDNYRELAHEFKRLKDAELRAIYGVTIIKCNFRDYVATRDKFNGRTATPEDFGKDDFKIRDMIHAFNAGREAKQMKDIEEVTFKDKIDKAQTCIMYDVDGGLLSHTRYSIHNREVDVALVLLDISPVRRKHTPVKSWLTS